MGKFVDAAKWLLNGIWIAALSVAIASVILLVGAATLGDLLLRFFRKQ